MTGHTRERWLDEEDHDTWNAAYLATKAAIIDADIRMVIPGEIAVMAVGLMLHPVFRNGMPERLEAWLRQRLPELAEEPKDVAVPPDLAAIVIWVLMIPGVPQQLRCWVLEQVDRISIDELTRNRIRRRMGLDKQGQPVQPLFESVTIIKGKP